MVVFAGVWSVRYVDVCECVADGMRIKTQMALSELNVTVEKSSSSPPLGAAQIVLPEMTARDLRHLLFATNTPAWEYHAFGNTEVRLVSSHSNFGLVFWH